MCQFPHPSPSSLQNFGESLPRLGFLLSFTSILSLFALGSVGVLRKDISQFRCFLRQLGTLFPSVKILPSASGGNQLLETF